MLLDEADGRPARGVRLRLGAKAFEEGLWRPETGSQRADGAKALSCRDPDANEQIFVEDKGIQPIMEAKTGPMVPWTRLW